MKFTSTTNKKRSLLNSLLIIIGVRKLVGRFSAPNIMCYIKCEIGSAYTVDNILAAQTGHTKSQMSKRLIRTSAFVDCLVFNLSWK